MQWPSREEGLGRLGGGGGALGLLWHHWATRPRESMSQLIRGDKTVSQRVADVTPALITLAVVVHYGEISRSVGAELNGSGRNVA